MNRITEILTILKRTYPHAKIVLNYGNNWELLVSVILSAQCTDKKVNEVTAKLFPKFRKDEGQGSASPRGELRAKGQTEEKKEIENFASVPIGELEQDIRQTGFYRNKAKNILKAANIVKEKYGGSIPDSMEEILTLPGVGRKTANVVLGNAYGIVRGIAVDTHVRRFALKFNLTDYKDPKQIEKDLMAIIPQKDWFKFTYLAIEYGRQVCPARKHACEDHPLTKLYPKAGKTWPKSK